MSYSTAKNTVISPNFLVWKFCRKTQFLHSFRQKSGEITVFFTTQNAQFSYQYKLLYFKRYYIDDLHSWESTAISGKPALITLNCFQFSITNWLLVIWKIVRYIKKKCYADKLHYFLSFYLHLHLYLAFIFTKCYCLKKVNSFMTEAVTSVMKVLKIMSSWNNMRKRI